MRAGLAPRVVIDFRFTYADQIARLKRHRRSHPLTIQKCSVCAARIDQQGLIPFAFEFGLKSRDKRITDENVVTGRPADSHLHLVELYSKWLAMFLANGERRLFDC